jgi:hypothetical protein
MALALIRRNGVGPEHFSIYDGELKVGRLYRTGEEWHWDVDWFGFGRRLVSELAGRGVRHTSDLLFRRYWFWIVRSGLEKLGKGRAPTRDQAMADFHAAWNIVTEAGRKKTSPDESAVLQS